MLHASATVGKLVRKYSGAEQEQSRDLQSRAERAEREAATLPFEVCLVATSLHPHSKFFLQPLYCHSSCLVAARMVPDIIPLPSGWHPDGMRVLANNFCESTSPLHVARRVRSEYERSEKCNMYRQEENLKHIQTRCRSSTSESTRLCAPISWQ
jgi:hypothetical protein